MNQTLLSDCGCADAFKLHDLEFALAECTMMFVEHFGEVVMPGGGNYREMMLAVSGKVGWHHVIEDVNKLRTEEPDYVGGSVATWGGFCIA